MEQDISYVTTRFLEQEFDGPFERLGDRDHHVRADQRLREENPEDIVEEETAEEDAADLKRAEVNEFDAPVQTKCASI